MPKSPARCVAFRFRYLMCSAAPRLIGTLVGTNCARNAFSRVEKKQPCKQENWKFLVHCVMPWSHQSLDRLTKNYRPASTTMRKDIFTEPGSLPKLMHS